ncbi:MAG: zinc ABC transporter substrate-binding protein [Lachnospiraceae bacterium]|nr:zinc ABC transporter substrate-binding protein [Lachnospiraceae bacterium]
MKITNINTVKKTIALMAAVIMCLSLFGCALGKKDEKISIVCTIFPQYDFVRQITKECNNIEVTMLLKPGQESHDYDPSSKDILKIHDADVFIYVGGESDTWIEDVLLGVENKNQIRLKLMDMVDVCMEEHAHDEDEHSGQEEGDHIDNHEDHNHEYDEHVWTSPVNAMKITSAISEALCNIEAIDKEKVKTNTEEYLKQLENLHNNMKEIIENASGDTLIVADRFPILYFCNEYGLKYYAAFSGCATSVEPSTAIIIELIDKVNELNVPCIIAMEMSAAATAKHIAEETGKEVITFYPCHNVTSDDMATGVTYIDLMNRNMETLKKALQY